MDTVTKLRMAVGLLTRPSKHRLEDAETGDVVWVTAEPLLAQLHQAVLSIGVKVQGAAGTSSPLPINHVAFDLETRIRLTVADQWERAYALHHGQGRGGSIETKLRIWAAVVEYDEILTAQAERYCTGWVDQIRSMFEPVRRMELKGACPECGVSRVFDHYDVEGGTVTKPALSAEYSSATASCAACGAQWTGSDMSLLGRHLNGAEA